MITNRAIKGGRGFRRGQSLTLVVIAVTALAFIIAGVPAVFTAVETALDTLRMKQALGRIVEHRMEDLRSTGALYLANLPRPLPPQVHYFDADGMPAAEQVVKGYHTNTWVAILPNDASFTDGTAGTVGITSLREVGIEVVREDVGTVRVTTTSYLAPGDYGGVF